MPSATSLELFAFQLAVALGMFYCVNVLGRNSSMFGYESLTMFQEPDEAAHFNFMFRVVTPVVILIIVAAICYYVGADSYTTNLYIVIPYYIAFRLVFNLLRGRAFLLPWGRLTVQWFATLLLAWLAYRYLIVTREYLLPDIKTIGNEVWLAIAAYIYILSNAVLKEDSGQLKRSERYTRNRYRFFERCFGNLVKDVAGSPSWEALVFAVLIVEDFNRPRIFRFVERFAFRAGQAKTLGVMQVETDSLISDEESIRYGMDRLKTIYEKRVAYRTWRIPETQRHYWDDRQSLLAHEELNLIHEVLVRYNSSGDYAREVEAVYSILRKAFYSPTIHGLHPDDAVDLTENNQLKKEF